MASSASSLRRRTSIRSAKRWRESSLLPPSARLELGHGFSSDPSQQQDHQTCREHGRFEQKRSNEVIWIEDRWQNCSSLKLGVSGNLPSYRLEMEAVKHCNEGRLHEAMKMIEFMMNQCTWPSATTFAHLLKECARTKSLTVGRRIHAHVRASGLGSNTVLGNILINMYTKCSSLGEAQGVFDEMPRRDVFSWATMVLAYTKHELADEALTLFENMQKEGVKPDAVAFVAALKACSALPSLQQGRHIHLSIEQNGFLSNTFVANTLIDMYIKCGSIDDARLVFEGVRNRDAYSWTAMIAGYTQCGQAKEALLLLKRMEKEDVKPDGITFVSALKACMSTGTLAEGKHVHKSVKQNGFDTNPIIANTLIDMYLKCGSLQSARQVFDEMREHDVISWTTLITGYAQYGYSKEAFALHEQMQEEGVKPDEIAFVSILKACGAITALDQVKKTHASIERYGFESNVYVGSTLVDMYAKCGSIENARNVFDAMPRRNIVSWTALIAGYAQHGNSNEAFELFKQMREEGVKPTEVTFVSILKACASLVALEQGRRIHSSIKEDGLELNVFVGSALVDMYVKCGSIEDARQVFDELRERNLVTWNAMIAGYAQHGQGKEVFSLFKQMRQEGWKPDRVTFASVLSACRHAGLVDEAQQLFSSTNQDHDGFTLVSEHYACMVDLLGRLGRLVEAEDFINKMPIHPDVMVWMTLLGACRMHGHVEIGKRAFKCVLELDPNCTKAYVLLSNLYAAVGMWDEVALLRKEMRERGFIIEHDMCIA